MNVGTNWKAVGGLLTSSEDMVYWSHDSRFFMLMAIAATSAFLVFC